MMNFGPHHHLYHLVPLPKPPRWLFVPNLFGPILLQVAAELLQNPGR